jgi:hypothetical protein
MIIWILKNKERPFGFFLFFEHFDTINVSLEDLYEFISLDDYI